MRSIIRERLRYLFQTLQYRNYRLFFMGQAVSLSGYWMSMAAMAWLVHRLTGDPYMLGLLGFFMHAPTFLFAPLGGVMTDRLDRRWIMVLSMIMNMGTMLVLSTLTITGTVQMWHILGACALLGISKAFSMPSRQALIVDIVEDRSRLSNAIALNSSIFHAARLVGPMVAGTLIIPFFGDYGEGICFLLDALSYTVAIAAILAMRMKPSERKPSGKAILTEIAEGFTYSFGFAPVRSLMLLMAGIAFFGLPYATLLPVFAGPILGGDSGAYGLLLAAGGVGAMTGAIYLASRSSVLGLGRIIHWSIVVFGLALICFAYSPYLWLSVLLVMISGGASLTSMIAANTIIQTLVDDNRRGRVMSLFSMMFMGAMPFGALAFGKSASLIGAPQTILAGAIVCTAAGFTFGAFLPSLRRIARPVYVERGVLPG